MNPNTSVDSDLQKAIDDITKSTNGDPLFADPVAAPAPIPTPNTVGPFPIATPATNPMPVPMPNGIPTPPPMPNFAPEPAPITNPAALNTPVMPAEPVSAPTLDMPEPAPIPVPEVPEIPEAPLAPETFAAAEVSEVVETPEPVETPTEAPAETPAEPETETFSAPETPFVREGNLDVKEVKEAALRELAPILSKLDVPAEQKFNIYKNVIDNYHDTSVIPSAYRAASEIKDERDRGEALLYIVDSIDKM